MKAIPISEIDNQIADLRTIMQKMIDEIKANPNQEIEDWSISYVAMVDMLEDLKKKAIPAIPEKKVDEKIKELKETPWRDDIIAFACVKMLEDLKNEN